MLHVADKFAAFEAPMEIIYILNILKYNRCAPKYYTKYNRYTAVYPFLHPSNTELVNEWTQSECKDLIQTEHAMNTAHSCKILEQPRLFVLYIYATF